MLFKVVLPCDRRPGHPSPFNFVASYVCDIKTKLYTYIGRLDKFDKQERDILIYNKGKRVIIRKR